MRYQSLTAAAAHAGSTTCAADALVGPAPRRVPIGGGFNVTPPAGTGVVVSTCILRAGAPGTGPPVVLCVEVPGAGAAPAASCGSCTLAEDDGTCAFGIACVVTNPLGAPPVTYAITGAAVGAGAVQLNTVAVDAACPGDGHCRCVCGITHRLI